ncbi:MAG TPA: hypothetical protein VFZ22_04425 [Pyrinomonadaceae bacterium]|nr:hypothetical protein [Pyrinomonadaceae bacterium]
MRQVYLRAGKYSIGILVTSLAIAFAVRAQEPESALPHPESEPVAAKAKPDPDPYKTYVFPTRRERFDRYVKDTVGPFSVARSAAAAGIGQWKDSPEEWGQGMKGYGKRFASGMGRNAIQQSVTYGMDEAFGLDTRFHRSNREGVGARVKHAFLESITSRTKSGRRVISAPRLAGVYTGAIVASETWYPERYSYKDGLRLGTGTLLAGFGINLVREFLFNW